MDTPGVMVAIKVDIVKSQTTLDKFSVIRPISEKCNRLGFPLHGYM